jgi:hypothetical protein
MYNMAEEGHWYVVDRSLGWQSLLPIFVVQIKYGYVRNDRWYIYHHPVRIGMFGSTPSLNVLLRLHLDMLVE